MTAREKQRAARGVTAGEKQRELVARGSRNAEIAERPFLSEQTVAHHSAILRKLGASTRAEASAVAVGRGLFPSRTAID